MPRNNPGTNEGTNYSTFEIFTLPSELCEVANQKIMLAVVTAVRLSSYHIIVSKSLEL
jgi:hypothetical protein